MDKFQNNGVILQIGAGGVGGVVAHKMAINRKESLRKAGIKNLDSIKNGIEGGGVFSRIILASRTLSKCQAIADSICAKGLGEIEIDEVNADEVASVVQIIEKYRPTLVINVALPYQDLAIMEACLRTKTHYLDTANYEHPDTAHFEYKEQWAYDTRYKEAGIFALLGSGFDPGVTNVFCSYAQKHYFDEIFSVDILDCNAGDHGYAFATNFNPEINLREVSSKARYWIATRGDSSCSDSSRTQSLQELEKSSIDRTSALSQSVFSAQPANLTHDTRIATTAHADSINSPTPSSGARQSAPHSQGVSVAQSNTANTRIVLESSLDSATDSDSSVSAKNSPSLAEGVRGWVSPSLAPAHPNAMWWVESKSDSESATSVESNLALNPDLKPDSIYRKFEREEKHFQLESNTQNLENKDYCNGQWRDIPPLSLMKEWDYIGVGVKNSYLLYHEELESLIRNIRGLRKIRFFMTFGESYLTHMKVLENVGLLRIDEVEHNGGKIVPLEVLKTLLPDPASLASRTKGQTHIGCFMQGIKDGKPRTIYIYNICSHEKCYEEVNAQGVSYTTGVPAMIGAKLICEGKWGIGAVKNSSLGMQCEGFAEFREARTTSSLTSQNSAKQAIAQFPVKTAHSHTANTRILDSNQSLAQNIHFLESYNKERLALNGDMPRGAEFQGIDNGAEIYEKAHNTHPLTPSAREGESTASIAETSNEIEQKVHRGSEAKHSSKFRKILNSQGAGVWNMEQNDPDPFMRELNLQGLPYIVLEIFEDGTHKILEDGTKQDSKQTD